MSHLDDTRVHRHIRTHARVLTYKNKGKGHQMHQKMINASWDGHSLALNLLCSQKWPLRRPPPRFWQR